MAICNLFNKFNNESGNFLLFSQYVADITQNYGESDNYKVVPTKFVALNIDYSKLKKEFVYPNNEDINSAVPKYFQNCFENACAWCRGNQSDNNFLKYYTKWDPTISKNLFWNSMYNGGFITLSKDEANNDVVPEIMYFGDINMHSFNQHQGMGYDEIYCYIPTDSKQISCKVEKKFTTEREFIKPEEKNNLLEGHTDYRTDNYPQEYYINQDFVFPFDEDIAVSYLPNKSYNINTIVVLYSVFEKFNDDWVCKYDSIPLGLYLPGTITGNTTTNTIIKYTNSSYGTGTSYGLRICSRFVATATNGILSTTELTVDNSSYTSMCQLMSKMSENLDLMLDITAKMNDTTEHYKDLLSTIKNNRTNVPYVKNINGTDYWFINGRLVSTVNAIELNNHCDTISTEVIQQRLQNLMDNDPTNDYTKIYVPGECMCDEEDLNTIENTLKEIAKKENIDFEWDNPYECKREHV